MSEPSPSLNKNGKCLLCDKEITEIKTNGKQNNLIEICENPRCSRFIEVKNLENWIKI